MDQINKLIRNFKELTPRRMESLVLLSVKLNEHYLLDQNTMQLLQGVDSDGNNIEPIYRSASYADFKLSLNPRGVVDLKLSGDFHESIFINADKFPILFSASDPKTPELLEKYSRQVLGVNEKSLPEFAIHFILPELNERIRNIVRL